MSSIFCETRGWWLSVGALRSASRHVDTLSVCVIEFNGWDQAHLACRQPPHTVKKSPPTFVQAGPMDPWALMQKALLDTLVLQESALFQAEHAHAAQDQCPPGA